MDQLAILASEHQAGVLVGRTPGESFLSLPAPMDLEYLDGLGVEIKRPTSGDALWRAKPRPVADADQRLVDG